MTTDFYGGADKILMALDELKIEYVYENLGKESYYDDVITVKLVGVVP